MNDVTLKDMKTVVMAGGQGSRLRPLTSNRPKPMVPVANRPMMEHIVDLLREHGSREIVVTVQFLPTLISDYFESGAGWGIDIKYVTEESPLGTAGSVKNAREFLDRRFLVVSGDALTDIDLTAAARFHREREAAVTIVLKKVPNPLEFGIVIIDDDGRIIRFLEKPGWGEVFSDTINTGIYIIEPEILDFIPDNCSFDFSKELFPLLLSKGLPMFGYVAEGYWCDIGDLQQYVAAHKDILDGKVKAKIPGHRMENGVWIGDGVEIDEKAIITGPALIGSNVKIEPMTKIREYTVLGNNVVVKRDNFLHRSVVMGNTYVGPSCHIRGAVIGNNGDIKAGVSIEEGAVVGDECLIGDNAMIGQEVLIFPFKTVDSRATINNNIVWESRGERSLFGKRGVSGLINVDITPEKAVRLGMAYGSTLPVNSQVVTSRDGARSARIIKRAFMAGLNASGVHINDLEVNAIPVNRFTVDSYNNQGGVDIRTGDRDSQLIEVNFYDEEARDLDREARRKIEMIFNRGDFRRAFLHELGEIFYPARAREAYVLGLTERLDLEAIIKRKFKVVFDYRYGAASLILPGLLGKLGCEVLSLNAFTDESRMMSARPPREESLERLGEVVRRFGADMGLLFDNGTERLAVVDAEGGVLAGSELLVLMVELVTRCMPVGTVAVPVDQPSVIDQITRDRGYEVQRTRLDRPSLIRAAWKRGVVFAGGGDGGFIFPDFIPTYDAMMAFARLLQMLAEKEDCLSDLRAGIPSFHTMQREVFTSWENKGTVMRQLLEEHDGENVDTTDGVKVYYEPCRWVLVLPDQEEPVLHLFAEGSSESDCSSILDRGENEVKRLSV